MTNTDTCDVHATAEQIIALANTGSELVRITVNNDDAARSVPEIVARIRDAGLDTPIAGDFHYNGHILLAEHPECARMLDKYRINPGNVGGRSSRDEHFARICGIAAKLGKPVRIGVNAGSLDRDLVEDERRHNTGKMSQEEIINHCMVTSALRSIEAAKQCGLTEQQIIVSCKASVPLHLIAVHRELAARTNQPLHVGLTEAGMGIKGVAWSAASLGVLLAEGIGDTIRVSLTPRPDGDRCEEVVAAREILQALGLRRFAPSITMCPGCGRTTSRAFQDLADKVHKHVELRMPEWRKESPGVEQLVFAVMGCVVNGPGESRMANVGISLPGSGENPKCPVYVDGENVAMLTGGLEEIASQFLEILEEYVSALPKEDQLPQ
jgi:(E)-4-hydroxy-3-methylbut-2-enyl-diphosphate synthase